MENGIFRITIDEKGRFMIPKKLRSSFDDNNFILTYGVDKCLQLLSAGEFEKLKNAIYGKVGASFNRNSRLLLRRYVAPATEVSSDVSGRIAIPRALREDIGIPTKMEAIFVSAGSFMEIWSEKEYLAMQDESVEALEVASQEVFDIMNGGEI
jgi:MraZ protein